MKSPLPANWNQKPLLQGFTLIELMVVVTIIGVIAAISAPSFRVAIMQGHLQDAKPHLMRIAAAQRNYQNRTGAYFGAGSDVLDEQNIENNLGVNLKDASDFCFIIRTQTTKFVSPMTNPTPDFEIWAVLRDDNYSASNSENDQVTVTSGGINCITADEKNEATGWVQTSDAASEGRVVVLRYPPPSDTRESSGTGAHRSVIHDWINGISEQDAILD